MDRTSVNFLLCTCTKESANSVLPCPNHIQDKYHRFKLGDINFLGCRMNTLDKRSTPTSTVWPASLPPHPSLTRAKELFVKEGGGASHIPLLYCHEDMIVRRLGL